MRQATHALQEALDRAGITSPIADTRDLTGGCIHQVMRLTLEDETNLVAKITTAGQASLFEEEASGLRALAETETVIVPRPLATVTTGDSAVLLMEAITPARATDEAWRRFGEDLADLHAAPAGSQYGSEMDNHLGTTPQPNEWCESWVEFNRKHRLGHQVSLAESRGVLRNGEAQRVRSLIDRLEELIPDRPKPARLHGDLWAGNAMPTVDGSGRHRIAVIDPAMYVGDGWADIAMMRLFGGFSASCFNAYAAKIDDHEEVETRIAVYQLYHVLNHVNLFGRGYAAQAMTIVDRLR